MSDEERMSEDQVYKMNRAKVFKAVYLLLQKYHRLFGLAVLAWTKPPGNDYLSFCTIANRQSSTQRPDYSLAGPSSHKLTIYQTHPGMPAWDQDGRQVEHPDCRKRQLRSRELVAWYESNLDFEYLFDGQADAYEHWRRCYPVDTSERYLATWNAIGTYAADVGHWVATETENVESVDHYGPFSKQARSLLRVENPVREIVRCGSWLFGTNGHAAGPGESLVRIWDDSLAGRSMKEVIAEMREIDRDHTTTSGH